MLCAICCVVMAQSISAVEKPITIGIEAEDFQYTGNWISLEDRIDCSGSRYLFAGEKGADLPAATAVTIPKDGIYHLWVRARDFADNRPGTRTFTLSINGWRSDEIFGDSHKEGFNWEPGGAFTLKAGDVLISIHDLSKTFARMDALLLTTDANLKPDGKLGSRKLPRVKPQMIRHFGDAEADPLRQRPITVTSQKPAAVLENEFVRYKFMPAVAEGAETIIPAVEYRRGDKWVAADVNAADEVYAVLKSRVKKIRYSGTLPLWELSETQSVDISVDGRQLKTARTTTPPEIWRAGEFLRFMPITAQQEGGTVILEFAPLSAGQLRAEWRLLAGRQAANVKLRFTPAVSGSYSLGYHLFFRQPLADVEELQLPLAFQRKRFPEAAYMVLDPRAPTPLALAQVGKGAEAVCWGVVGDPSEIPFAWPDRRNPNMGLCIRDEAGNVQPSIYGPVPTMPDTEVAADEELSFAFNVLVQPGEWYAAYRTAADEVFEFRDYRKNVNVSLSDAVHNMIDLLMDDEFGGWWEEPKGWYQIESRNTVTHSTPATMLSVYKLTSDQDIYRRRVLPTLEYVLSRGGFHFTPAPHDSGRYNCGPMGGPLKNFGSVTYSALETLCAGNTPAFRRIAFPATEKISRTQGYSHAGIFNEWAVRYRITGNPDDLKEAMRLADEYLEQNVVTPPTKVVGHTPFWLISFVPDWEGLLMMYEMTGKKRYLDGAVIGARQLMVGLWTQPLFPDGETTIFPGGKYEGDPWNGNLLARGADKSRLGFPLHADSLKEHKAPAWQVACVGLGFEQPSTLGAGRNRLIYQAVWAPEFLRLARYTGDKAFETCARNAVVGRWANYPGYYVAGHMDMVNDPQYPYVGPDQSTIYYHHIVPHLSWCIDYLVSEAEVLSDGEIKFPWVRENGYAFFDGRVYGHAPGKIYGEKDCWLWLNRNAAQLSNCQINTLTAYNANKFYAILINQTKISQSAELTLSRDLPGAELQGVQSAALRNSAELKQIELHNGVVKLDFKPRELLVVELAGTKINVAAHHQAPAKIFGNIPSEVDVKLGEIHVKAAAIAVDYGAWDAFVWSSASPDQAEQMRLETYTDGKWVARNDNTYPFEFSTPMTSPDELLRFRVSILSKDGQLRQSGRLVLGISHE